MMTTPKGAPSAKYAPGRTWKRHLRIEKIARLTVTGMFTNEQIAASMNIHIQTIVAIRATPEFQAKILELSTGVISEHDKNIREVEENQLSELSSMLPSALLVLRNSMLSKNENIALKAAESVMDREGRLAKVSKVNIKHDEIPDLTDTIISTNSIMQLLQNSTSRSSTAIIDSFTVSAADASGQLKIMSEDIDESTLAHLDLGTKKPN